MNNHFNANAPSQVETEISLVDIFKFIQETWKLLLGAGIVGAFLGLGGSLAFPKYTAGIILQNNGSFDIRSWRSMENLFPILAAEMLNRKVVPENQVAIFKRISSPTWFKQNVRVNYLLSKTDGKELPVSSKNLESVSDTIQSFVITSTASSEAKALNEASEVTRFISNGATYIAIKDLLLGFERKSVLDQASVQAQISATEIEIAYLSERAKNLELLQKSYPNSTSVIQQLVDPKDSGAKYLPLTTQIIAIKSDIIAKNQALKHLNDELSEIKIYQAFLDEISPQLTNRFDGIAMLKILMASEENLRAKSAPEDIKAFKVLDGIQLQLKIIKVKFGNSLYVNNSSSVNKSGNTLKNIVGGSFITGFLMLAFLLGNRALRALENLLPTAKV
ncbi:hypothetical protein ICV32_01630 [Polynucleobacter sp. MWH-UH24A]|uniref:hypothetical protein n=1 Tax=Polynucleobacter sp. MWH-UH24A TaxID=2689110 RepID=UPI001BFE5A47|nr:hypothetical protein [Polynucleobacter sp. MWH-UH24A]QWD76399.1 hypothetical protein ICV32_01630 [Polynucleobacter sp. MWH-UH24A]